MQNTNEPPIKQLTHELKYENKWMKVYEDKILRSSGKEGLYGVVEKGEFALIVPFDGKYLYLVEQYRYPLKVKTLEFPQGMVEKTDADITESARRELKEETPLCRIGTPDDIAAAVSFLASPDADFITGQILGVNGGMII